MKLVKKFDDFVVKNKINESQEEDLNYDEDLYDEDDMGGESKNHPFVGIEVSKLPYSKKANKNIRYGTVDGVS